MSNRHLAIRGEMDIDEYRKINQNNRYPGMTKPGKKRISSNDNQDEELNINDVINYYMSNKKDKNVRKDTKELLLEFLNQKYSDYQIPKKGKKRK
jgi:hypothetical protein